MSERDPSSPAGEAGGEGVGQRIEITGDLDRTAVEALQLEIRHLARLHGVRIADVRIDRAPADEQDSST